ncbi:MAG: multicomponent Na+:H+ antiporter subunit [Thermotogaceae bacterium]|jgi:multicomponent Na+:H+ antiporter subunit C|nr:multicomponent Na+:H+ antiporter subunit [Thermotogaceae bacterium]MDN5337946.1 multicomponent Na+:H+ antiporter subunit [Thermotogaceae bacterium]
MVILVCSIIVFFIGFLGTVFKKSLILKMLSLGVMNTGVITFFVSLSYRSGKMAPIIDNSSNFVENIADPVPQAVIITSIVIGFAILTFSLVYIMLLTVKQNTMDVKKIEEEIDED